MNGVISTDLNRPPVMTVYGAPIRVPRKAMVLPYRAARSLAVDRGLKAGGRQIAGRQLNAVGVVTQERVQRVLLWTSLKGG